MSCCVCRAVRCLMFDCKHGLCYMYYTSRNGRQPCMTLCNARPMSKTLGRRCIKVIQMFCVCWVDSLLKSCTLCCMPCSMIRDQLIYDNHPAEDAKSTSLAIHVGWIASCIPWHLPSTAELMQFLHQRSVTDWCVRGRALSYQIWCDWHYVFLGGLMELTSTIISLGTIRPKDNNTFQH